MLELRHQVQDLIHLSLWIDNMRNGPNHLERGSQDGNHELFEPADITSSIPVATTRRGRTTR
jgi:hypothetical protein